MKNITRLVCAGIGILGLSLTGCLNKADADTSEKAEKPKVIVPKRVNYFAYLWVDDAIAITSGDFNEDGHLDIIVGVDNELKYYEGDGKGNFKLRTYPVGE